MERTEFENKCNEFKANHAQIVARAEKQVSNFVTETLGPDFSVLGFSARGFHVSLMRDGEPVFGASWEVYVGEDWLDKTVNVSANVGTAGSFRLDDDNDDQLRKYQALAIFMSQLKSSGMIDVLKKCFKDTDNNYYAYNKLVDEFNKSNNQ